MACEITIPDIPVSVSLPNGSDLLMFHLLDGTTVVRSWSTIALGIAPDDVEFRVTASGGLINNGETVFTIPAVAGHRCRVIRGGVPQYKIRSEYSQDVGTGEFTISPAATTGEDFIFQPY